MTSDEIPPQLSIYRLPKELANTGQKYGLCIFNYARSLVSPAKGYYERPQRFFEYYSISHLIKGKGKFWMPDIPERRVEPGQLIVMTPFKVHRYGASESIYCEDHICFTGPIADFMMNCGIIKPEVFHFGMVRRLLPIMETASCPSMDSQFNANLQLQRLLLDIYLENRNITSNGGNLIENLLKELKKNISHWWTISEMSEYCQISDDLLRKLFLQHTGMLPKEYLDRLRMGMAAIQLIEKQQTVKEISRQLGYRDLYHFSRRFKAIMGLSPQNYKKRFGKDGATTAQIPSDILQNDA